MVMTSFSHHSWFGSAINKCIIKNVQPGIKIILNVVIGNKIKCYIYPVLMITLKTIMKAENFQSK